MTVMEATMTATVVRDDLALDGETVRAQCAWTVARAERRLGCGHYVMTRSMRSACCAACGGVRREVVS